MPKNVIVVDLGYGDSGKGTVTDWLSKEYDARTVVRYNGGAQCYHMVYHDNIKHGFQQFSSGTFAGCRTVIGPEVIVNPLTMLREAEDLKAHVTNPFELMTVANNALVVTPYHRAVNYLREFVRVQKHGSTGMGIGETRRMAIDKPELAIRVKHLGSPTLADRLRQLRDEYAKGVLAFKAGSTPSELEALKLLGGNLTIFEETPDDNRLSIPALVTTYRAWYGLVDTLDTDDIKYNLGQDRHTVVYEGAQGVLLDKTHGFHPYTTWSDTTPQHALDLIGHHERSIIGVTRTFATRHGAGPFVTENLITKDMLRDEDNGFGALQGKFRHGCLDFAMLEYAMRVCKERNMTVNALAVTHCDKLDSRTTWPVCHGYLGLNIPLNEYRCNPAIEGGPEAQAFTERLMTATPMTQEFKNYRVLDDMVRILRVPIFVKSFGKKSADKIKLATFKAS